MKTIFADAAVRICSLCCLLFAKNMSHAQVDSIAVRNAFTVQAKVIIQLNDGVSITASALSTTDSSIAVYKSAVAKTVAGIRYSSVAANGDSCYVIPVEGIKLIRLKRNAFLSGFVMGGLVGYGLGYGIGYVTGDLNNSDNSRLRGNAYGIVGAAAMGLVSGAVAPTLLHTRFIINGKREALQHFVKVLNKNLNL